MTDIRKTDPNDPALTDLLERHLELMRASSPACSVHAMDAARLADAGVQMFAGFENGVAVAMGAIKQIDPQHGELKSMHVRADRRGTGLADRILERLLEEACVSGFARVSLETGSQEAFWPARSFYARHQFTTCAPFGDYTQDPNSVFMTRRL